MKCEAEDIRKRYEKRKSINYSLYGPLEPYNARADNERRLALIRWIRSSDIAPVSEKKLLEVGCGGGPNLLQFLLLGFRPENLVGIELLEERALDARHRLPAATKIILGDATEINLGEGLFDVVFQSTVFTSILNDDFQKKLADGMWNAVAKGGGILWHDYIYNNPRNPDVRGVPISRVRELFPHGRFKTWRVTLAPPIGRPATRIAPWLYPVLNAFPFLRTHVLCWIRKV